MEQQEAERHPSYVSRLKQAWRQTTVGNKLIVVFTAVIALSNFFYMLYARRQWKVMSGQLTVAQNAINQERDRFRQEQRPYIWVTLNLGQPMLFEKSGQVVWAWHVTNYGKTPAYHLKVYQFGRIENLETPQFKFPENRDPDVGPPLPPNGDQFNTVVFPPKVTREQFNRLMSTDGGLGIRIRIEYTDSDGGQYETGFCYARLATGALNYCPTDNYIK